jgi:hypothetical protein
MPATLAEVVDQALDGIGDYLASTAGLTEDDGVLVRSGPVDPPRGRDVVMLGDVTMPQSRPGLQGRQGTPTVNGWVIISRPGGDETAIRAVRARATAVMGLIEGAVQADPSMAGTIQPPGGLQITTSGLQQSPEDWNGTAARHAEIPFSLSWTSHIT